MAFSADLTRGKGGFNTLMGLFATSLAVGGVLGPLLSGVLVQHLGFRMTFYSFAALAAVERGNLHVVGPGDAYSARYTAWREECACGNDWQ